MSMVRWNLVGGVLAALVLALLTLTVQAQLRVMPVVGFLGLAAPGSEPILEDAFRRGLKENGFVDGKNVTLEFRSVENRYDLLSATLTDLVRRKVAVIVAGTDPAAVAAKSATHGVPTVFLIGGDPVAMGLVTSLQRPGTNFTGMTGLNALLLPKKLELLHQVTPSGKHIAALVNPVNSNAETLSEIMYAAARTLGLQLHIVHAASESDFEKAFAAIANMQSVGVLIGGDPFFISRNKELAALALRHAVPAISHYREFAIAGGLMSYGGTLEENYHFAGIYAGRILNGEKPANLPVMQTTKAELVINLKTAQALGLTIPKELLQRADEVIQ
jgi:putative tryptophan/tyrosine transport system substrate-binding protein